MVISCACSYDGATTGAGGTQRSRSPRCSSEPTPSPWTVKRLCAGRTVSRSSTLYTDTGPLYAFDLLELDGEDLRSLALGDRKRRLAKLVGRRRLGIVVSEHTDEDGAAVFRQACKMGLEGIVSKRLSAPYRSGVSRDWLKVKNPDSPAMVRARMVYRPAPTRHGGGRLMGGRGSRRDDTFQPDGRFILAEVAVNRHSTE
jgi:hypothetical protein